MLTRTAGSWAAVAAKVFTAFMVTDVALVLERSCAADKTAPDALSRGGGGGGGGNYGGSVMFGFVVRGGVKSLTSLENILRM